MARTGVAIIADIVRSRQLDDRRAAQDAIERAFAQAHREREFQEEPYATVGDEFQAVSPSVGHALWATAAVRLQLGPELDCRFGLGRGEYGDVAGRPGRLIQEGEAWERARAAIEEAHEREDGRSPYLRGWYAGGEESPVVNAYLLVRDHAIDGMSEREARLTAGILLGRSQAEMAREEGISQAAVSQSLRRSGGAAIIAGDELLGREEALR